MRIYISGPITGNDKFEEQFLEAQELLECEGYEVINPSQLYRVLNRAATWEEYMEIDESLLAMCQAVVFLPGWEASLGCQREMGYARAADKPTLEWKDMKEVVK